MPISRFGSTLVSKKIFHDYMSLLKNSFSSLALKQVMCRGLISIDYNGYVYGTEITRGLDVFKLIPSKHLSKKEIEQASKAFPTEGPMVFNPQQQIPMSWPNAASSM